MNVVNGVEVSAKRMGVLGMIENGVNGKENMKSVTSDIENEGRNEVLVQFKGMPVKSAQEVTLVVKPPAEVSIGTKEVGIAEVKNKPEEALNSDLERKGIKRLAEIERLAEKERQEKIRRREELDRVARLQRILALVRAPELDSVAKMKQMADLERVEMTSGEGTKELKESDVVAEVNPALKLGKVEVKKATELKQAEHKAVVEALMLAKKKEITESEGIGKMERMSKSERISEINRLINLELEAEAKHKAEIERISELERLAELERVAKMNRLTEIDLSAEIKKAEKERLEERKCQEKIKRREELERVAKLQRILAMILAAESDQAEEAQAANLERVREMKRRDELKLLEELGILPKEQMEIGKMVKQVEGETLVATLAKEGGANPVEEAKPVTELKDVNSDKVVEPVIDRNQLKRIKADVEVETMARLDKLTDTQVDMEAEAERDANLMSAADRRKADRETRKRKRKEELERIANLQRIIAMTLNPEVDQTKQAAELEKVVESKRKEEINILDDLGILPKSQVLQQNGVEDVKQVTVLKTEKDMKVKEIEPLIEAKEVAKADIEVETVSNTEQLTKPTEIKSGVAVDADREAKIRRVAEMENKAKADREARIKRREELARVANLQRVVAVEFDRVPEMKKEELQRISEKKLREDMKVLEELGLVSNDQVETNAAVDKKDNFTEIKPVEDANIEVEFKAATEIAPAEKPNKDVESLPDHVIHIEQMSENERMAVKRDVESRMIELRVAQMRRLAELGREMKMDGVADQAQHRGFKHFAETERTNKEESDFRHMSIDHIKTEVGEMKGVQELKPSSSTRLSELKQAGVESKMKGVEVGVETKMKRVEEPKSEDFEIPTMKRDFESVASIERKEQLKPADSTRGLEIKNETGVELIELKRLREMKRMAGIERVSRRDCEWDEQMMYVGRA